MSRQLWELHQVPALVESGYRVITVDNRGIPLGAFIAVELARPADLVGRASSWPRAGEAT